MYKMSDIKSIKLYDNFFLINGHPTKGCNYKCSYCCSQFEPGTKEEDLIEQAKYINNFINDKISPMRPIYFKILGGEVTYYNGIKILDNIERINYVSITTNFSNKLDYYKDLYTYLANRGVQLSMMCSHHPENTTYFEKIVELTKGCKEHKYKSPICRLMVDNNFDLNGMSYLKENKIRPNLSVIRDKNNKAIELKPELTEMLNNYYAEVRSNPKVQYQMKVTFNNNSTLDLTNSTLFCNQIDVGGFDPTGFTCSAGHNGIYLKPNGDILKSGCAYGADKVIGNIKNYQDLDLTKVEECKLNCDSTKEKQYCSLCGHVTVEKIQ